MAFDPTLPQTNAMISSAELRSQFTSLKTLIDQCPTTSAVSSMISSALYNTARNPGSVATLGGTVSNPPTQSEVLTLFNKLNELILALKR